MESFCAHLTVYQSQVRAGKEISSEASGWSFFRVCDGSGYMLDGSTSREIETGDVVVIPAAANVRLRASQLGDMRLCHFGVRAEQLIGFLTADERQALQAAPANGTPACRLIKRDDALARRHGDLCDLQRREPAVVVRSAMLALAVQALRDILTESSVALPGSRGPEKRLAELAARVPESELLVYSTRELADECGCTERHFRRLFATRFGMSLKQRQTEWHVEQAKKLLAETSAKIIDVASQCGFPSLGQFNLTFKSQTRMSPGAWRKAFTAAHAKHQRRHPPLCPRPMGRTQNP